MAKGGSSCSPGASVFEGKATPALAYFPGFEPAQDTQFRLFHPTKKAHANKRQKTINASGHTDRFVYSAPRSTSATDADMGNYALAVFDSEEDTVKLYAAPLLSFSRKIRKFEDTDRSIETQDAPSQYESSLQARKDLGAAFGTKKRQREIERSEVNRVEASMVFGQDGEDGAAPQTGPGTREALASEIGKTAPSQNTTDAASNQFSVVPPHDPETTDTSKVYDPSAIFGNAIFQASRAQTILDQKDDAEAVPQKNLPFRHSRFVNDRLLHILNSSKPSTTKIEYLYVISAMMSFFLHHRIVHNREQLASKMGPSTPPAVIDTLIHHFTESTMATGMEAAKVSVTSRMLDKLLCHMFILCLHVDDFSTDISQLASDLTIKTPHTMELFKTLGCRIAYCTETQRIAMGLSKADAKNYKRAVLKIPLEFPKPKRGARR